MPAAAYSRYSREGIAFPGWLPPSPRMSARCAPARQLHNFRVLINMESWRALFKRRHHCRCEIGCADGMVTLERPEQSEREQRGDGHCHPLLRPPLCPVAQQQAGPENVNGFDRQLAYGLLEFALNPQVKIRGLRVCAYG